MLSPYRVLDLCDDRGNLAGFLLAQMGAEVILVEPPGGHRHRRRGPYAGDVRDPERSLEFWGHNRGKASVELTDPALLDRLAEGADVLLECGAIPVDLAALRAANPALVTVSISPFGGDGPKAGRPATDIVVCAASGIMSITGDADRPPVRVSLPQSWYHAAADAACAALFCLHERHRSGLGQHADVSAQESMIAASQFQMMGPLVGRPPIGRLAGGVRVGPFVLHWVYPCADGHVTVSYLFGAMMGPYTNRLFRWMHELGECDDDLAERDWVDFAIDVLEGRLPASELDRGTEAITRFVATRTKAELLQAALDRSVLIAPITTTRDVLDLEQLAVRGFWEDVDGVRHPGRIARFEETPCPVLGPPPRLGADTARLAAEPARRPAPAGPPTSSAAGDGRPLAGLKILDFTWALAAPVATRMLADHGATVVKVETQRRADVLRGVHPFRAEEGDQEGALQFHSINANKLGITLDLATVEARGVAEDLVRWADVVTESFAPGAMTSWDLDDKRVRELNPEAIMLSSCLLGQTGPLHRYAGFGTMAAAIAGFYPITGWPDRLPAGPFTAYTDYICPRLTVVALLSALEHRRRTGRGQYVDFSQMEAALHLLTPALLDEVVNGRTATRHGNADAHMSPHGVYPCRGDDAWVAIACETDDQWRALANVIGADPYAEMPVDDRLRRQDDLDQIVTAFSRIRTPAEVEAALVARGVPAHAVLDADGVVADPQLRHRGQFIEVPHEKHGTTFVETCAFDLSRTPAEVRWGGPTFGQHTFEVLTELLGYDTDRIAELAVAGALE